MEQTYTPNIGHPAKPGWCLQYVDDAGNVPAKIPPRTGTAKKAFNNEKAAGRIRISGIPENVWLVGWLDFTAGPYTVEGHVFFIKRTGSNYQIYDSEVQSGQRKPYGSLQELLTWFGAYKPVYIGWSTHCDGREYAKVKENKVEVIPEPVRLDVARCIAYWCGRDGRDGRWNALNGDSDSDLNKYQLGNFMTPQWIFDWMNSEEMKNYNKKLNQVYADRNNLRKEVESLKKQLAEKPGGNFVKVTEELYRKG